MRFQVTHHTRFHYSQPVYLEQLTVRLRPRVDFRQRLLNFSIKLDPAPLQLSDALDLEGNSVSYASFCELTASLTITTSFTAETLPINPFDFVLRSDGTRLPLRPAPDEERHFGLYARPQIPSPQVAELARRIAGEADSQSLAFVTQLNEWVFAQHENVVRPTGAAWSPDHTLEAGRGACRDLVVLFMEACRVMNVPSRFVSGYSAAAADNSGDDQLHAWAEVHLPGAGWRGFDPSLGLAITDSHLAVAAGVTPEHAAPTSGTFRGDATSHFTAAIQMQQNS